MENDLKQGDTIKCLDPDDAVEVMTNLEIQNIHTDFVYEKDGIKGIWLVVTGGKGLKK